MNKNKKFYREKYQGLRLKLLQEEVYSLSDKIFSHIQKIPLWDKNSFHVFMSSNEKKEVETNKLLSYLYSLNKIVATSKMLNNQDLVHLHINNQTKFVENSYSILEPDSLQEIAPDEIDIIFIPLLCFDKQGNRVGYGGGYYDKFLANTKNSALKIGLSFFEPVELIGGINKFDVPLDMCVTPGKVYDFRT